MTPFILAMNLAAMSARVGLWLLLHVIVLAGVAERWLAGEGAVCRISPPPASTAGQARPAGAA